MNFVPRTPGIWFGSCLIILAALVIFDLDMAAASQSSSTHGLGRRVDENGVVHATSVELSPGDVMTVWPEDDISDTFGRYEFYIVESGEAAAFFRNETPEHVYVHREYDAAVWTNSGPVYFERPQPPAGHDGSRIEMVWILHYGPAAKLPTTDEGWVFFNRSVAAEPYYSTPWVSQAWAVRGHRIVTPILYVVAAATLFVAVWYVRDLVRPAVRAGGPAESGLGVVELGGRYLRFLRGLLIGLALPLLYLSWSTLALVWGMLSEGPAPDAAWEPRMQRFTLFALTVLFVGWSASLVRIETAYRRWRRLQNERPLEA